MVGIGKHDGPTTHGSPCGSHMGAHAGHTWEPILHVCDRKHILSAVSCRVWGGMYALNNRLEVYVAGS